MVGLHQVGAIAFARGRRAIVKYVAKVRIGKSAAYFNAREYKFVISFFGNGIFIQGLGETRPTGSRLIFIL